MKNLIKYITLLIALFYFGLELQGQPPDDGDPANYEVNESMFLQANYTSVSSPEAASLGKFGDYNVNTFTGGLSLNIPLCNLSTRSLNYGLSLVYDGTGNKVETLPSWSGLGWSLTGVPVITRTVKGKPDTHNNYYSKSTVIQNNIQVNASLSQRYAFYQDVEDQLIETQADEFNITFPGGNVKFYVMYDLTVVMAEQHDIKIIPSPPLSGDNGIYHFTVKDANGNTYYFNEIEETYVENDDVEGTLLINYDYNSAYYCSTITSSLNNDVLSFTYLSTNDFEYYYDLNPEKNITTKYGTDPLASCSICKEDAKYILSPSLQKTKGRKFLDNVEYRINGSTVEKIKINSSANLCQYKKPFDRRINTIQVFEGDMSTAKYEIDFDFNISEDRLKLTQIQKVGHDGVKSYRYGFNYFETQLPEPSSSSIDAWGYYNNNGNSNSLIPTINGYGEYADRQPDLIKSKAGVLKSITYPTGGYSEFDYKLNRGRINANYEFKNVGGLRIQSVNTFDSDGSLILKKEYEYVNHQNKENGIIFYDIKFQRNEEYHFIKPETLDPCNETNGDLCCEYICSFKKNSTHNTATIAAFKSTHIGYPRIEEHLYDGYGSLGKNIYHYEVNHSDIKLFPNLVLTEVFDSSGIKVSETENIYMGKYDPVVNSYFSYAVTPKLKQNNFYYIKEDICNDNATGNDCWTHKYSEGIGGPAYKTKYEHSQFANIRTYRNFIETTIQRTFYDSGATNVIKTTDYDYDPDFRNNKPTTITISDGNNFSRTIEYTYPYASSDPIHLSMKNKNILHAQLEVRVNNGSANGIQTIYGFEAGKIVPITFNQLKDDGTWKFKASIDQYASGLFPKEINKNTLTEPIEYTYYSNSKGGLLKDMTYGNRVTDYTYTAFRELESITDYNGIASAFLYDGVGRLKQSTSQNGRVVNDINYNQAHTNGGDNKITSVVNYALDSSIPTLTFESIFDGIGRKLEDRKLGYTQSGNDYITTSIYNGLNSVIRSTDPATGGTTVNEYEASPLQRVQNSTPPGSPSPLITIFGTNTEVIGGYAPSTLYKTSIIDENGIINATYSDVFGRQIATITDEAGLNLISTYTYNDRDQVLTIQPPGGGAQYIYTYFPDGLLESKTIPDKGTYYYTYNDQDQLETETQPNGEILTYSYDPVYNEFLRTVTLDNQVIIDNTMVGHSGWLSTESVAIFDETGLTTNNTFNHYINHDDLGRPEQELRNYGSGISTFTYLYDDAGNITETTRSHISPLGNINYTMTSRFDKGVRNIHNDMDVEGAFIDISDLVFDDREWLQSKSLGGGLQGISYDYNPRGWLTQINSVESTIPGYIPCNDGDGDQPLCDCFGPYTVHSLEIFYDCLEMATGQPTNVALNIISSTINGESQSVFDEQTVIIPFNGGTYDQASSYSNNISLDLGGGLGEGGGGGPGGGNPGQAIDDVLQYIYDCLVAAGLDPSNNSEPGDIIGGLQYAIFDALNIGADGQLPIDPTSSSDSLSANLFGMEIHYFDGNSELNAPPQYNGNISWIEWANFSEPVQRYGFSYDGANRLLAAKYEAEKIEECDKIFQGVFDVNIAGYDPRGNILGITRNGITEIVNNTPTFGLIDDLTFIYNDTNSNLLDRVDNNANIDFGFSSETADYTYDTGNLKTDSGKKITNIDYNYMDLPLKIEIEGNTIFNTYDANGRKLRSRIISNSPEHESVTYDYMDGIEYKDESLEAIYNSEGRYIIDKENESYFEFFLKDHLGNTRVRFADKDNNNILDIEPVEVPGPTGGVNMEYQEYLGAKSYYPFGMEFSHNAVTTDEGNLYWVGEEGGVENRYTYNGKEYIDDLDINLHDYGFRYYDPAIARFTTIDPLAEEYSFQSGFAYASNNPIKFIDFMGLSAASSVDMEKFEKAKSLATNIYTSSDKNTNTESPDDIIIVFSSVSGYGHVGLLVGDDDKGWRYLSKNGAASSSSSGGNDNTTLKFNTLEEFKEKVTDTGFRYTYGYRIETDDNTDESAIKAASGKLKEQYNISSDKNCTSACEAALEAAKVEVKPTMWPRRLMNRLKATQKGEAIDLKKKE